MEPVILNQRYRLVELVGAGGMATVYRGQDLLLERVVAVKFLREPYASNPAFRERFLQEARSVARLDHPHIVHIYDVGEDAQQQPYIVMELVRGEDLKTLIRREGPLPVPLALNLIRQMCEGVGHAHRAGIIHCDLKPQNILVTPEGKIKVADFGIARAFHEDLPGAPVELEKVVWGSPHYLSPEQASGRPPTPAVDVYSLGVILYEMLTGVPPFHDADPNALIMKHLREEPVPPTQLNPRIPPGLELLVRKVLSKQPAQRYRNADQFGMAVDSYLQQGTEHTRPQATIQHVTPPPPTRQAPTATRPTPPPAPISQPLPATPPENTQPVAIPDGPDTLLWGLIVVAAIAVLGLIPLWMFVVQTYSPERILSAPSERATNAPATPGLGEMVSVPNLVSLSAADAQRLAESLNLLMEVQGERETTDAPPGAILEQTPSPGSRVTAQTTIQVIVAAGRTFTLPDIEGYNLDAVQDGLESQGLILNIEEIWSAEYRGLILTQTPQGGTEMRAGDTLTLTVSGGVDAPIALQVNLNHQALLEEVRLPHREYRPGDTIPVTLRWRCTAPLDRSYKVFIHLLTPNLTLVAQSDQEPLNGLRPTTSWTPGEIISDPHQLRIPPNTPAGVYHIRVGLYTPEGRLPVVDPGYAQVLDHAILVTDINIAP